MGADNRTDDVRAIDEQIARCDDAGELRRLRHERRLLVSAARAAKRRKAVRT